MEGNDTCNALLNHYYMNAGVGYAPSGRMSKIARRQGLLLQLGAQKRHFNNSTEQYAHYRSMHVYDYCAKPQEGLHQ
jgi:hypothetical protein